MNLKTNHSSIDRPVCKLDWTIRCHCQNPNDAEPPHATLMVMCIVCQPLNVIYAPNHTVHPAIVYCSMNSRICPNRWHIIYHFVDILCPNHSKNCPVEFFSILAIANVHSMHPYIDTLPIKRNGHSSVSCRIYCEKFASTLCVPIEFEGICSKRNKKQWEKRKTRRKSWMECSKVTMMNSTECSNSFKYYLKFDGIQYCLSLCTDCLW